MSEIERRRRYARAIWDAMVSDSEPDDKTLWEYGYDDAAEAAMRVADDEQRAAVACPACDGDGYDRGLQEPERSMNPCPTCGGSRRA